MKIVFFDGYCSLCNNLVDWLMDMDTKGALKFASLQGKTAARLLGSSGDSWDVDTIVYLRDENRYERSTAILFILSDMGGWWRLTRIFFLVPRFFRDFLYGLVARNRYRIFIKRDSCRMPSPEESKRLLP